MKPERSFFYQPEAIFRSVQDKLTRAWSASERVDYLTFVPDGEPMLDVNLGREITLLKEWGIPVAVITNGSLLWRDDVRAELGRADWVSLKIDSIQESEWRRINHPHKSLRLDSILDGMLAFAHSFTGEFVTETMLVKGLNDSNDHVKKVAEFLHTLRPRKAYLSIPTRPPAVTSVRCPNEDALNIAYQIFAGQVNQVEYLIEYEGNDFSWTGDIEADLLSITAVHPMREDAVRAFLSRAKSSWKAIERLVAAGNLAMTEYNGQRFFLRKYTKEHEAAR